MLNDNDPLIPDDKVEIVDLLNSFYLFDREYENYDLPTAILARAGIDPDEELFNVLVKLGVCRENENTDVYRYNISAVFPDAVNQHTTRLITSVQDAIHTGHRKDVTILTLMNIDGQSTLEFDGAIS